MLASPSPIYQYYIFFFSDDISICFLAMHSLFSLRGRGKPPLGNEMQLYTVLYEEKLF